MNLKDSDSEIMSTSVLGEQPLGSCFMCTRSQNLKKIYLKIRRSKDENHNVERVFLGVFKSNQDEAALIDQDITKCVFELSTDTTSKQFYKKHSTDLSQEEEKNLPDTPKNDSDRLFWTL